VWIEDLTMLEVRDLIKGGKTTALILTGGIEARASSTSFPSTTTTPTSSSSRKKSSASTRFAPK